MEGRRPWLNYHERTQERGPGEPLKRAVELVTDREAALDLGAGALVDSKYMLEIGFRKVIAIDSEPTVRERAMDIGDNRLEVVTVTFEDMELGSESFDLINAQYSLPFIPPQSFDGTFEKVRHSLKKNGVLVGQLFGTHDEWSDNPAMTFHDLNQVKQLLSGMEIIELNEEERDGPTAAGTIKHWHVFHVIARKGP